MEDKSQVRLNRRVESEAWNGRLEIRDELESFRNLLVVR